MAKMGRPCKVIDWKLVDDLCEIQCTGPEIAAILKVNIDTMTDACKREHGMLFSDYIKIKSVNGKKSLRRKLFECAMNGNTAILIWLSKQYLGMTDAVVEVDANKVPIKIIYQRNDDNKPS